MTARLWIAAALTLAIVRSASAQPAPSVSCDILEISASSGDKPAIDKQLEPLQKKLKKAPFSSWNQFRVLMKSQQSLAKKQAAPIKLKIGSASATLVEIVDKSKVRITITIDDASGKQLVNNTSTVEGGDYLVYGHSLLPSNDGHLLALTCK